MKVRTFFKKCVKHATPKYPLFSLAQLHSRRLGVCPDKSGKCCLLLLCEPLGSLID
ncbi:unnamed protein product [Rodentolepis nana]|uniref:Uncharacterized protein n=1 Tax=Rodentolepis nana TaxID=102285 RepID=A0A3P7T0N2_RODNA|nr:unnamed protein product [Rodentolepis nana]